MTRDEIEKKLEPHILNVSLAALAGKVSDLRTVKGMLVNEVTKIAGTPVTVTEAETDLLGALEHIREAVMRNRAEMTPGIARYLLEIVATAKAKATEAV